MHEPADSAAERSRTPARLAADAAGVAIGADLAAVAMVRHAKPPKAAQEYRERGRRGGVTVRFAYRVPNG